MSGIVGIVRFDGAPAGSAGVAAMTAAAPWRGVDGEAAWIDGCAAIGHQYSRITPESLAEKQPFVAPEAVVSFDGRLDNRDELIELSGRVCSDVEGITSDAALVAAAYRAIGSRCAGRLVGDFAFALFDTRARKLLLARDVMAARTLYYAPLRGGIVFASEIKSLLAVPEIAARPDEDCLADLVLNGYCDAHRTWFDGIWSVPPGAIVTATAHGVAVTRAWDFDDIQIRYRSFAEYCEHFHMLFAQAVKRRLRSVHPVAVAVSGGLDSSAIHCEAARLRPAIPVRGVTLAYPRGTTADEHEFIAELRHHGLVIDDVPVEQVRWLDGVGESVARTEMPGLLWDAQDSLLVQARRHDCRVVLNGFFADQLLAGQAYLVDFVRAGRWRTTLRHLDGFRSWMIDVDRNAFRNQLAADTLRSIVPNAVMNAARRTIGRARTPARYPPWFTRIFRERAYERALERAPRTRPRGTAHAQESWRRATSGNYLRAVLQTGCAGLQHQVDTVYPYRDRDLVAFLMAIPGDIVCHNGVPKGLLRHAMEGVVPDTIRWRRSKGDGTAFSNQAALAAEQTVRRRLGGASLSARAGFIDAKALESHLAHTFGVQLKCNDTAEIGWQIADTLALDLWLERFCKAGLCN